MSNELRVMVVEDNEFDMTVITSALDAAGIDYKAVSDSREVLQVAIEYKPSIAILDIQMPEFNGKQVREQLLTRPETSHIKVIFLSASDSAEDVLYGLNLHFSGYFKKGVQIGHVIDSVMAIDCVTNIRKSINEYSHISQRIANKYLALSN
jgi:CheY-like chemotaxis protein